jgi:hypothetical protein
MVLVPEVFDERAASRGIFGSLLKLPAVRQIFGGTFCHPSGMGYRLAAGSSGRSGEGTERPPATFCHPCGMKNRGANISEGSEGIQHCRISSTMLDFLPGKSKGALTTSTGFWRPSGIFRLMAVPQPRWPLGLANQMNAFPRVARCLQLR